eukprot:TRINITY_DN7739_c0_g1_i5.p1 TRINITY_DN7739_c0_g1~~TRINITY_DN7739_c0_g1_i5.p1  ORF type:complete len:238 (+),score=82.33 TRINITY_DN7739_c0_g1_i5:99-812(+)
MCIRDSCWGCLKTALEASKECPKCQHPATVSEVQVGRVANAAIGELPVIVAITHQEGGHTARLGLPLGLLRELQEQHSTPLDSSTTFPMEIHECPSDSLEDTPAGTAQHKRKRSPKSGSLPPRPKQHTAAQQPMEEEHEVESGCSDSQSRRDFYQNIVECFEHSARQLERHAGGCSQLLDVQYVRGVIDSTHARLTQSMRRPHTPSGTSGHSQEARGGVDVLAAIAQQLLAPPSNVD